MGPTWKKKKTTTTNKHEEFKQRRTKQDEKREKFLNFFSIIFFLRFTETCPSEFVGINTESALRDEGYA